MCNNRYINHYHISGNILHGRFRFRRAFYKLSAFFTLQASRFYRICFVTKDLR
jgi:hypothetical protein